MDPDRNGVFPCDFRGSRFLAVSFQGASVMKPQANFGGVRFLVPGAMLLAANAGFINAVGLGFFHSPVSHMSGAVSHLGLDVARTAWGDARATLLIIVGFLLGAVASGILIGASRLVPGRHYGTALMAEGGLLAFSTWLLATGSPWALPLASMALGLQNAMASSYCGFLIRTTHVTGTVTDIGVMIGHWIRHRAVDRWKLGFLFAVFGAFAVGGWFGALGDRRFGPMVLALPAGLTTLAGMVYWFAFHRGLVDLLADPNPVLPATSSFPNRPR